VPTRPTLTNLKRAAQACRGCELYRRATQAVMGEGPRAARVVLVGEQPGDHEDQQGRPFVGPAGKLLDRALERAGLERGQTYVTNAVKHFKWSVQRGKLRLHAKPDAREIRACRPWLEAELGLVEPDAVIALGATAARALFGPAARVTQQRNHVFVSEWARCSAMTVHPSALLRIPEADERHRAFEEFVRDLRGVRAAIARSAPASAPAPPTRAAARSRRSRPAGRARRGTPSAGSRSRW
jgi:DNA polymerase